jgi:preprotein translocase subunit YajC
LPFSGDCLSFSGFEQISRMITTEIVSLLPLAQAAPSGLGQLLPIALLFLGMWFLIIAPQRKRQKTHDKMLSELKKGDVIVTSGGIHGTITKVNEASFVVEIAENTKVQLGKSFVASKVEVSVEA